MAENKTQPTRASVAAFLDAIDDAPQRADAKRLLKLLKDATGDKPVMWGPSIVGFGSYHYKYASGREGDTMKVGFSPRKGSLVLYVMPGLDAYAPLLAKLGKFKAGKGCLSIKRLADVDESVLGQIAKKAMALKGA